MSLLASITGFVAWLSGITGIPKIILYAVPITSFIATLFEEDTDIDIEVRDGRIRLTEEDQKKIARMLNDRREK